MKVKLFVFLFCCSGCFALLQKKAKTIESDHAVNLILSKLDLLSFRSSLYPQYRHLDGPIFIEKAFASYSLKEDEILIHTQDWRYTFIIQQVINDTIDVHFIDSALEGSYYTESLLKVVKREEATLAVVKDSLLIQQ